MGGYAQAEKKARRGRIEALLTAATTEQAEPKSALLHFFDGLNDGYMRERDKKLRELTDADAASKYSEAVREAFRRSVGTLPPAGSGRATVTKTVERESWFIDHVLIEGLPGVWITANFYYPKQLTGPAPSILMFCGHSARGKAELNYASFCVEAVSNGFCVLIVDPIGQGERQIYAGDEAETKRLLGAVDAHCFIDRKLVLHGQQLVSYMIREGTAALDYLLSRPETDPARIAAAGNSGGGTMTAFMAAYDDRIKAAVSCSYISDLQMVIEQIKAQDAEQCPEHFIEYGLNLSDLMIAAAPKPFFVGANLFDFFPVDGVRKAALEALNVYFRLGADDRFTVYVSQNGHGLWADIREQALKFLCRHFGVEFIENKAIDYEKIPAENETSGETSGYETSVLPLIRKMGETRKKEKEPITQSAIQSRIFAVLGNDLDLIDEVHVETSISQTDDVTIKRIRYSTEPGIELTAVLTEWRREYNHRVFVVVVDEEDLDKPSEIPDGYSAVLRVAPRGCRRADAEAQAGRKFYNEETAYVMNARMLGRNLQAMRVADVTAATRVLMSIDGYGGTDFAIAGREEHALTALYAAIVNQFREVQLEGLLYSYESIVNSDDNKWSAGIVVPFLAHNLDIADLLAALLPGSIHIDGLLDAGKKAYPAADFVRVYADALKFAEELGVTVTVQ